MKKKRIGLLALVLILLFSTTALAAPKLAKKKVTLKTGNAYVLKLSGNKKSVKWTTSDKSVVQIVWKCKNRAVLRAKQEGTSTVTAKIGKKKLTCQVTVKKSPAFPSSRKVIVGDKFTLSLKKKGNWSITSGIARLSAKKAKKVTVTATAPGTAVIQVKVGKKTYKCKLTVITKKGTIPTPATGGGSTSTGGTTPGGTTTGGTTGGSTGTTTGGSTGTTTGGTTGGSTSSGGGTTTGGTTGGTTSGDSGTSIPSGKWTMRVGVYEKGSTDNYEGEVKVEAGYTEERDLDVWFFGKEIPTDRRAALNAIQISVSDKSIASVTRVDVVSVHPKGEGSALSSRVLGKIKIKGLKEGTTKVTISPIKGREFNERSSYSFEVVVSKNLDDYRAYKKEIEDAREKGWKKLMSDMGITGTDLVEDMVRACRYVSANYNYLKDFSYYSERKDWTGQESVFSMIDCFVRPDGYSDRVFGAGGNCISSSDLIYCIIKDKYGLEPEGVLKNPRDPSTSHTVCQVEYGGVTYLIDCGYSGKAGYRLWDVSTGKSGEYTFLVAGTGNKIGTDKR